MWGRIVVITLSVLLFIATELLFPIDRTDALAVKQKHFWAFMFLVFSLVLGLPIQETLETQAKIDEVKALLREHQQESATRGKFQELYTLYDHNFGAAQPVLRGWADETLNYLRDSWSHGIMPLPREMAPAKIGDVYYKAQHSIIATNIGSTKYYFNVHTYGQANIFARDHGVPVIRFYLYGKKYRDRIELRDGRHPADINDFFGEIKDLHSRLGSLYSAVIDVDRVNLEAYRDLLIMDNKFVAETQLSPEWEPLRALATENSEQLEQARQYFHLLLGAIDDNYVLRMKAEDVRKYFKSRLPSGSGDPADALFNYLMGQAEAGPQSVATVNDWGSRRTQRAFSYRERKYRYRSP